MRYAKAKYYEHREAKAYRIYIADTLYYRIAENKKVAMRYSEMLTPKKNDTRSGDEIAYDVINRLGLKQNGFI